MYIKDPKTPKMNYSGDCRYFLHCMHEVQACTALLACLAYRHSIALLRNPKPQTPKLPKLPKP